MRENVDVLHDDDDDLENALLYSIKKYPHFVLWTISYYPIYKNHAMSGVVG
jgi:hypothetical protein